MNSTLKNISRLTRGLRGAFLNLMTLAYAASAALASPVTIFSENFESATKFSGNWARGGSTAAPEAFWDRVTGDVGPPTHGGSFMAFCSGSNSGYPASYSNSMDAYMTRTVDLRGYSEASISFWYIIPTLGSGERCSVYIDQVDAAHEIFYRTVPVTVWTQSTPPEFANYGGGVHTLIFLFHSDASVTGTGWFVDDIAVSGESSPFVETLPANAISAMGARLNAVVNPNKVQTDTWFQYGPTTGYGNTTATRTYAGNSQDAQETIGGLLPETLYHYRIVAMNVNGRPATGDDVTFTTAAVPPSITAVTPALMPALSGNQSFVIEGEGYKSGATLEFTTPSGSVVPSVASKLTAVPPNKITYQINNDGDTGAWQVIVRNPDGQASNSSGFTVYAPASPPSTIGPGSAERRSQPTVSTTPTFVFTPPAGAARMGIYISRAPYGPDNIVYSNTQIAGDAGSFTVPPQYLALDGEYRWNMTSFDAAGNESVPSQGRYIATWSANLPTPVPIGPGTAQAPGLIVDRASVTPRWNPVQGAAGYGLFVYAAPFSGGGAVAYYRLNLSDTSAVIPEGVLEDGVTYKWAVMAYGPTGLESAPSAGLFIRPEAPSGVAPAPTVSHAGEVYLNQAATFVGGTAPSSDESRVAAWEWRFSDAPESPVAGRSVQHTFVAGGRGSATLTVTDAFGRTNSATLPFELKGNGNPTPQGTSTSLDPVNLATGNFVMDARDLTIPGRGLPFVFERFDNSKSYDPSDASAKPGPLGWGWTHNFEIHVREAEAGSGARIVVFGDGHSERFELVGGSYVAEAGVHNRLVANPDGTFTLTAKNQIKHNFAPDAEAGRLTSIVDRNGNVISVTWDANGRIDYVTDTAGRRIDFEYDPAGNLSALVDPIGRRIEYTVDAAHDLRAVKNARGHSVSFTYDALHQVLTGTDARGHRIFANTYDDASRTVIRQLDADGNVTRFDYHFDAAPTAYTVVAREAAGGDEVTKHYHDSKLRLVKRTDGRGDDFHETFAYDEQTGDLLAYVDKNGNRHEYAYDGRGNRTYARAPDGGVTTTTYNAFNDPVLRTSMNGAGSVTAFWEYDAKGNRVTHTFPYDAANPTRYRRTWTVDGYGQVKIYTDANRHETAYYYDGEGNNWKTVDAENREATREFDGIGRKTSDTDGLGHKTSYTLDGNGNVTRTDLPDGTSAEQTFDENDNRTSVEDQLHRVTRFAYDRQDRLIKTTDALLRDTIVGYDELGNRVSVQRPGQGSGPVVTRMGYDLAGNLVSETDPLGHTRALERDGNGNLTSERDADGVLVQYAYDAAGRRTKVITAPGEETVTGYDLLGRRVSVTDAAGRTTTFGYNDAGQQTSAVDADGKTFSFAHDDEGNLLSATHGGDKTRRASYDGTNRVRTATDENGNVERLRYDRAGNLWTVTDADGNTITYGRDALNRVTSITPSVGTQVVLTLDDAGQPLSMTDGLGATSWTYTPLGQVETTTDPFGQTLAFGYDPNGNRSFVTYPGGRTASYAFDAADRPTAVTDWQGRAITKEYTDAGRVSSIHFPNGVDTVIGHDGRGREDDVAHGRGGNPPFVRFRYGFDRAGNAVTGPIDHPLPPVMLEQKDTYAYDGTNQLAALDGAPFGHDKRGNVRTGKLSPSSAAGDSLSFDAWGRLSSATIGGATSSYAYDGLGHRLQMTRGGAATRFVVDGTGSLAQVMAEADGANAVTAYYLYFGGLAARILPDGTALYYHTDRAGNVAALTGGDGLVTDLYRYDPFGVPMGSSGPSANPFRYLGGFGVYDDGDGTLFARARYYHPGLGRFLSRDPLLGDRSDGQSLNRYVYALNNPIGLVDVSGFKAVHATLAYFAAVGYEMSEFGVGFAAGFNYSLADQNLPTDGLLVSRAIGNAAGYVVGVFGILESALEHAALYAEARATAQGGLLTAENAGILTKSGMSVTEEMSILRQAAKGTGNYGLGTASRADAMRLGEAWVGNGYKVASDGTTLISADGLRQFRPPSLKANPFALTGTQANFEIRSEFGKAWSGNGHLNIIDP